MRKILIALLAAIGFTSCSEDKVEPYMGTAMTNLAFLEMNTTTGNYYEVYEAFVPFVEEENVDTNQLSLKFRVSISDVMRDYPRTVTLTYTGDFNPDGQPDFPKTVVIPANELIYEMDLVFNRPAKADEARENTVTITSEVENGLIPGVNKSVVVDFSLIPGIWPSKSWTWNYYLGVASKTKYKIVYEVFGTFTITPVNMGFGVFDFSAYTPQLKEYVEKYNEDPTQYDSKYGPAPLKDENGDLIVIGN